MGGSRKTMATDLYLPDDCWEYVFRFLNHHRYLESLSLVSKQLLSITNRLRFSLTICDPTLSSLPRLFHRFPNLTSLDLTRFHRGDLDALLRRICRSSLDLRSLKLSNRTTIPADWLRALAKKMKNLTSLTCSEFDSLSNTDIFLIADCFPFLEELDLSFPKDKGLNVNHMFLASSLPNLRKVNLSGHFYVKDQSLFNLCKNCEFLEEVVMRDCKTITHAGIASAIRERPSLRSFSVTNFEREMSEVSSRFISSLVSLKSLTCLDLSRSCITDELLYFIAEECLPLRKLVLQCCYNYTYAGIFYLLSKCQFLQHLDLKKFNLLNDQRVAELSMFLGELVSINVSGCKMLTEFALFALVANCPMLNEIRMEETSIGKIWRLEDSNSLLDFVVNPSHQVKSLHLARNSWCLKDESIRILACVFPNLQLLDLSDSYGASDIIVEVLRRCCNSRSLKVHSFPKLEVLNLSSSNIDDETLFVISKSCCGLLQLDLENCHVTEKGVRKVVENCTQLREINLRYCNKVAAAIFIAWMVLSRPSLRMITAPPCFRPSERKRKLFLRYGCLVC